MSKHLGRDVVDRLLGQWAAQMPDLDAAPVAVVGRISRAARLLERETRANLARHGLEPWEYDVLAALRRSGPPFALNAGALTAEMLVSPGAMTNRIDRLAGRGLVYTGIDARDRRSTVVTLTDDGRQLAELAARAHVSVEAGLLASLPAPHREHLGALLRELLLALGDSAADDATVPPGPSASRQIRPSR